MRVLACDPSINHLGWALMGNDVYDFLSAFGTINAPTKYKGENLVKRINWMIDALDDVACNIEFDTIAIECPEPWGAYKSMASSRSGSLQMLTLMVGAITLWACNTVAIENVKLVKVSQHKGQLPKRVTQKRMEGKYHRRFVTDHEADAANLGDYVLNRKELNGT